MYHYFFIHIHVPNEQNLCFIQRSDTNDINLQDWIDQNTNNFLTIQKKCQNKLPITIAEHLSEYADLKDAIQTNPEWMSKLKDTHYTEDIFDIIHRIQTILTTHTLPELTKPSLATRMNHVVLNVYANGESKYNVVRNEDIISNFLYNTTYRFGRMIYIERIRMYDGCIKYTDHYDTLAATFFNKAKINRCKPTIPYQ